MPIERALNAYKIERLNCAQSILRAFQEHRNIPEEVILQAKQLGGGRAEDGLCGALYTALQLVDDPAERQRVREAFTASAGSDKCREIRRAAQVPCVECVKLAAGLVHQSGSGTAKP